MGKSSGVFSEVFPNFNNDFYCNVESVFTFLNK
jgi:hypothetical protein